MGYGRPALAVTGTNPDIAAIDQIRLIANTTAVPISMRLSIAFPSGLRRAWRNRARMFFIGRV
jgi:hypothetical protein